MRYLKYKLLHTVRQLKYKRISSGVPPLTLQNAVAGKLIDYKIYGNSIQDGTPSVDNPVEIENVGDKTKNLFSYNGTEVSQSLRLTAKGSKITLNGASTKNIGTVYNAANNISLTPGTYKMSYHYISGKIIESSPFYAGLQRTDGSWFPNSSNSISIGTNNYTKLLSRTVEVTETMDLCFRFVGWGTVDNLEFGILLENNDAVTPYEPYGYKISFTVNNQDINIYLDEPLRKKDNYADYIDYETQKLIRKVEVIDDTGTLPIEQSLQPLPVPTEETIELPDIALQNGTNIIDVSTTVTPSNIELKYYSKEKE